MEINRQTLYPYLLFDREIPYNDSITLFPVRMKDILTLQQCQNALTLRKDAVFREKTWIKMGYLEFIQYAAVHPEIAAQYQIPFLPMYFDFTLMLLKLVCGRDAVFSVNRRTLAFSINGLPVTDTVYDDLRKIILIQNEIDFNPDEFLNMDTVNALEKARAFEMKKNSEKADIEDYIDSLATALKMTGQEVSGLTVRKFWRYIKRINRHEEYQVCRTAAMSGMVTFKTPIRHWMTSIEDEDHYKGLKTDEDEIRNKIGSGTNTGIHATL